MNERLFSQNDLRKLIFPLFFEQLFAVTVGMIDIIMVSAVSEAAMSGVSLVDSINILLINVFSALATGGAVVSARFVGNKKREEANSSAEQLLLIVTIISILFMFIALLGNRQILNLVFGDVEAAVMDNATIYFYVTALSFPFLGIYNACAALCRSMGNSKVSMKTSLIMNLINVIGNAILIYGFHFGVLGVAIPTLISRIVAAVLMYYVITDPNSYIHINKKPNLTFRPDMIKQILRIGIPTGLENSIFQLGKILVQSLIASFGTAAIAANAVAGTFASFEVIPGSAISLALITVVGQSIGSGRLEEAKYYTKQLMKTAHLAIATVSLPICLLLPWILKLFSLSPESYDLAYTVALYHGIACIFIWPPSFSLPNVLRAADEAKYTMKISLISMWLCRIVMSYVLGRYLGLGLIGVWIAMTIDWIFRGIFFLRKILSGKWLDKYQTS